MSARSTIPTLHDFIDKTYKPVYIDADNVAQWLNRMVSSGDSLPEPIVFVPPFANMILDYSIPDYVIEGYTPIKVTVRAFDAYKHKDIIFTELEDSARWVVYYDVEMNGVFLFSVMCEFDESGELAGRYQEGVRVLRGELYSQYLDESGPVEQNMLWTTYMAISLMHCKNVELVDKPVSRQYRRMMERKGEPITQYKTLVIEPFKKQVRNEARESGQNEIERALHICRGHFRTYSEDKPLFGKISGTFWIPMHVRGNAGVGTVEKDYKVVADDD